MMLARSRVRIVAVVALVAAAALAGVLVFTGGASGGSETLAWSGEPRIFKSGKPTDRVLTGRIENASLKDVELDVDRARVVDADGEAINGTVRFLEAFVHGLWSWSQSPSELTEFERRRLGQLVTIKPGKSAPIALSWRVPEGGSPPERVDFGNGVSLDLP